MKGFKELPSTSIYIKEHINELENFDSVFTSNQTEGRGRTGHTWVVEPNKNATFSLLIKDKNLVNKYNLISIIAGISVSNYLDSLGIPDVELKWPNDVLVKGKKICGILLEGKLPDYVIVGIGINVNQTKFEGFEATSIKNIIGMKIEPSLVAVDVCNLLIDYLKELGDDLSAFIDEYEERDCLLNKNITFNYKGENLEGVAKGINLDGSLKVVREDKTLNIFTEEVNIIRTK